MCEKLPLIFPSQYFSLSSRILMMIFIVLRTPKWRKLSRVIFGKRKFFSEFPHTIHLITYKFMSRVLHWCVIKWKSLDYRSWLVYCAGTTWSRWFKISSLLRSAFLFLIEHFPSNLKRFPRDTNSVFSFLTNLNEVTQF